MSIEFTGFDDLQNELKNLEETITSLDGSTISFEDLFTQSFMLNHTKVSNFDDFLSNGNFKAETQEEFDAIPESELDKYISSSTDFDTWEEMLSAATDIYLENIL